MHYRSIVVDLRHNLGEKDTDIKTAFGGLTRDRERFWNRISCLARGVVFDRAPIGDTIPLDRRDAEEAIWQAAFLARKIDRQVEGLKDLVNFKAEGRGEKPPYVIDQTVLDEFSNPIGEYITDVAGVVEDERGRLKSRSVKT